MQTMGDDSRELMVCRRVLPRAARRYKSWWTARCSKCGSDISVDSNIVSPKADKVNLICEDCAEADSSRANEQL
jgi:hypothetical protein